MTLLRKCLPLLLVAAGACADSSRPAMGDVNSIIVVAADSLWAEVSDTVLTTLQPRVFAVRQEPTFKLTHTSPGSEHWAELQRFRQLLVIGRPGDAWVDDVLEAADASVDGSAIVETPRVWARNQHVTALVVPESDPAGYVRSSVDSLAALLDLRYRNWASNRMYISGHDTALVDTLRAQGRFSIDLPEVYRWRRLADSAYAFLNDNPDASQLVRWLTVTWRPLPEDSATLESVLAWRDSIAASLYDWGQTTGRDPVQARRMGAAGAGGLEVRGVWSGMDEFPQAGPFIARTVDCPAQDRRYLLDAWLYAPARDKYQYLIQLETLLDSFECAG
ncbi:MAG: DUF4837 family protein [Gemmatimonadota bacterium]|jgi:hypothetical protein